MEAIEYNDVDLEVLQNIRCHREQMIDAIGNYLKTRWEIEVICQYQPKMTSYRRIAGGPPERVKGQFPGETDLATLNRLLTPRKLLKVTAGAAVILQTPATNTATNQLYPCDAEDGPFCKFVSAPKMVGVRHWTVHLRFLAHTNDGTQPNYQNGQDPVVSNTWTGAIGIDKLFYPTLTVNGKALLRTDVMRARHITADTLRPNFFFPLQANHVRENVWVELSPDGASLDWGFTDVGRCYNVAQNSPILDAEVFATSFMQGGSIGSGSRANAMDAANGARGMGTVSGTLTSGGMTINRWVNNNLGASGNRLRSIEFSNLPQYKINVRADLWGSRDASNDRLTRLSLGICLANGVMLAEGFGGAALSGGRSILEITQGELICRQELTNRFVSSEITFSWGADLVLGSNQGLVGEQPLAPHFYANGGQGGVIFINSLFKDYHAIASGVVPSNTPIPGTEPIIPYDPATFFQQPGPYANPAFGPIPNRSGINPGPSQGCYGTLIERLVVQLLQNPSDRVPTGTERVQSPNAS